MNEFGVVAAGGGVEMLQIDRIKAAAEDVVAAALLAEGWTEALTRFAAAAGARDAVLMRNNASRMLTAVTTDEVAEAVADFAAGRAPPNSRYVRVRTRPGGTFRVDHDDYSDEELARDPFYQEFLRPRGVFWHANVILAPGGDEFVELSLKRRLALGPYLTAHLEMLNAVLPELHAAARLAKSTLDAETRGMSWVLRRRGGVVFELDAGGRVLPDQNTGDADRNHPLRVVGKRLATVDARSQRLLDDAIAAAVARRSSVGLVPLTAAGGREYFLQIHPVPGAARDVFLAATAIAVLIERNAAKPHRAETGLLRQAFGLTARETEVTLLLAEGLELEAIAAELGVRVDTVRTYLKDVFQKTGTSRQAELVSLVSRLLH